MGETSVQHITTHKTSCASTRRNSKVIQNGIYTFCGCFSSAADFYPRFNGFDTEQRNFSYTAEIDRIEIEQYKMGLCPATVSFATVLAVVCISSEVFGADPLYCFSCHGYDKDSLTKCKDRKDNELFVRKCTTNSSLLPACLKYTAYYKIPQMMGKQLKMVESAVHGLHCGTLAMCARSECPNFWPKDLSAKKCEVSCCTNKPCSFPMPNKSEIDTYEQREAVKGNAAALGVQSGKRSSGVTRISVSLWIQGVVLAFATWLKA